MFIPLSPTSDTKKRIICSKYSSRWTICNEELIASLIAINYNTKYFKKCLKMKTWTCYIIYVYT